MTAIRRSLVLLSLLAATAAAQGAREKLVVSPQWLNDHLKDPNVVVLHVGPRAGYDTAHVAGARFVELSQVTTPPGPGVLTLELPAADTLRATLARLGISDNSRIVVYPAAVNGLAAATRIVLTLDHAGLGESVSLLDGGLAGWTRAGFATTADVPAAAAASLSPLRTKNVTVGADYVRDNLGKPGFALVDARATGFFSGAQESGPTDARRKGHIDGAVSVPYSDIVDAAGMLKPAAELEAMFAKAGVKPGDTIVTYCHIGQQATATLFAARTLGYNVKLYDGSFEDWARRGWPVGGTPF